jgi:nucleoside-diphosphate-sugar epimerase
VTEEMFHRAPAIGKIKQAIGWEPTIGLDRILADVIESVRLAPTG